MILVDTCVLLDLSTGDPDWFDWSLRQITHFGSVDTMNTGCRRMRSGVWPWVCRRRAKILRRKKMGK